MRRMKKRRMVVAIYLLLCLMAVSVLPGVNRMTVFAAEKTELQERQSFSGTGAVLEKETQSSKRKSAAEGGWTMFTDEEHVYLTAQAEGLYSSDTVKNGSLLAEITYLPMEAAFRFTLYEEGGQKVLPDQADAYAMKCKVGEEILEPVLAVEYASETQSAEHKAETPESKKTEITESGEAKTQESKSETSEKEEMVWFAVMDPDAAMLREALVEEADISVILAIDAARYAFVISAEGFIDAQDGYEELQSAYEEAGKLREEESYEEAAEAFTALGDYLDAAGLAEECSAAAEQAILESEQAALAAEQEEENRKAYADAQSHMEIGWYGLAADEFEALGEYSDADSKAEECRELEREHDYGYALRLEESGDNQKAAEIYERLGDYEDAAERLVLVEKKLDYEQGVKLKKRAEYREAYIAFYDAYDYEDAAEQLEDCDERAASDFRLEEPLYFGTYQGAPIRWRILEKTSGQLLLISDQVLEARYFHTYCPDRVRDGEEPEITWENCELRTWLNGAFYEAAFDDILRHALTSEGSPVEDLVYLLSSDEVREYFETDQDAICTPTEHAAEQGGWRMDSGCRWWLRTLARDKTYAGMLADTVQEDGERYGAFMGPAQEGKEIGGVVQGVRPVVRLNIEVLKKIAAGELDFLEETEEPEREDNPYDRETVRLVQEALNEAGFDCGTPDGLSGAKTEGAIAQYRAANGLASGTGLDDPLLISLGLMEAPAEAETDNDAAKEQEENSEEAGCYLWTDLRRVENVVTERPPKMHYYDFRGSIYFIDDVANLYYYGFDSFEEAQKAYEEYRDYLASRLEAKDTEDMDSFVRERFLIDADTAREVWLVLPQEMARSGSGEEDYHLILGLTGGIRIQANEK